jgi:hypothetical protein
LPFSELHIRHSSAPLRGGLSSDAKLRNVAEF